MFHLDDTRRTARVSFQTLRACPVSCAVFATAVLAEARRRLQNHLNYRQCTLALFLRASRARRLGRHRFHVYLAN